MWLVVGTGTCVASGGYRYVHVWLVVSTGTCVASGGYRYMCG